MVTTSFLVYYVIYEFFHIIRYYVEERARNIASWQKRSSILFLYFETYCFDYTLLSRI